MYGIEVSDNNTALDDDVMMMIMMMKGVGCDEQEYIFSRLCIQQAWNSCEKKRKI